jgi:hypothetical protein
LEGEASQSGLEDEIALDATPNVYMRVSSRHLILASAMFKSMLGSDTYREGGELLSNGHLVIKLSDDPDELIILMHIVHGMMRKVPRSLPLHTVAGLANLINYYQLHEAVEPFPDIWIENLDFEAFQRSYKPKAVLRWLLISWVFQKRDQFEKMTQTLIYESDDKLQEVVDHESIPIPASIISEFKSPRFSCDIH